MRARPGTREWLVKHGYIDEHGVNATPRIRHCGQCGRAGWAAWRDGTMEAVLVDPVALTPYGELQAIMAGCDTFTHWFGGIDKRLAEWIRRIPASPENVIRPGHICAIDPLQFEHYPEHHHRGIETNDDPETIPF